jgi:hypothetical protein
MASVRSLPRKAWLIGGLLAAWVGVWGTWLAHESAGLTQGALDLAQVSQRLPDVLYGRLGGMPGLLRASVGLATITLSVAVGQVEDRVTRWALRALALILILRLLPPYPDLLALWRSPDYGGRFILATLALAGWVASLTAKRWPALWRHVVVLLLGLSALINGLWAYFALQHAFSTTAQLPFSPGWGLVLYGVGLLVTTIISLRSLLDALQSPVPEGTPA